MTVGEQPPVEIAAGSNILRVAADSGRAVLRQCVVPLGMIGELIHLVQVVDQQCARLRGRGADAIQVDLLSAVVGAQPDQVALIGDYIVELVLAEETAYRGI